MAEVITRAAEQEIPMALVTGTARTDLDAVLRAVFPPIGPADFQIVVTGDTIDPERATNGYGQVLRHLSCDAHQAVAVADTPRNAAFAHSAGLPRRGLADPCATRCALPPGVNVLRALDPGALGLLSTAERIRGR